jgi:hypothetical protein
MAGETELFIAKSVGATIDVFRKARKDGQFTDLKPRGKLINGNRGYRSPDITPDEIEERCREVQATWSEEEREQRAGGAFQVEAMICPFMHNPKCLPCTESNPYEWGSRSFYLETESEDFTE